MSDSPDTRAPGAARPAAPSGALPAWLDAHFGVSARGSSIRVEALGGLTTFLTMAYVIVVNPAILGQAGLPVVGVAAATCLAAAFASILMGLFANVPLALAPGMGLNAYFAFTVVLHMGVAWPVALACVFLSGLCFLLLSAAGIRQMIIAAIPPHLLAAVAGGIGLFIGFIGLRNAGIVVSSPDTIVALGNLHSANALLALVGLVVISGLSLWNVRAAVLIGIAVTTIGGWLFGAVSFHPQAYSIQALASTALKLDFSGVLKHASQSGAAVVEILFVLLFVDLFDNIGTLMAVTKRAGLVDSAGRILNLNRILLTDATSTMFGACVGTSTVTSYVESAAGVQVGARTGLMSVVVGLLFLVAMFAAPYAQLVPVSATAPALILVGGMMMAPLAEIDWHDPYISVPSFVTVALIPLTFSIANGIAFGIVSFAALKLIRLQATRADWLLFVLAALFIARFAWLSA